ncbi:MAG: sulfatase-like hydrolase/transferase [Paracoccaceae bacterium]
MTKPKNVLFIVIDQFRADLLFGDLGRKVDLPNLRAFADDAVSFHNHFSVTNPCGPSRVSLLTGQYAMNHRSVRNGTPLRHDTPNLATEARKAGYLPLLFGYTDVSRDPRAWHPNDPSLKTYELPITGFEEVVEMRLDESYPWRAHLKARGYDLPDYADFYRPAAAAGQLPRIDDPAFYRAEDSDTAFLTDACLNALAVRGAGWFAHLTYIRPHPPFVAPAPYNRMYDNTDLPPPVRHADPEEEGAMHPFLAASASDAAIAETVKGFAGLENSQDNVRRLRAIYAGLASEVDHHIGRVIRFLKDTGHYDNTLIVITADHGEMLGDHDAWGKSTIYQAAYHVPLMIRDPNHAGQAGRTVADFTESVDLMPTILSWIGRRPPHSANGRSLAPFLCGERPEDWRDSSYSELHYGEPVIPTKPQSRLKLTERQASLAILRTRDHTLVHFNGGLPPLLFDMTKKGEMKDMAGDPAYAGTLLAMTRRLLDHRMSHADSTLSNIVITPAGAFDAHGRYDPRD